MQEVTRIVGRALKKRAASLGERIHAVVRVVIEAAVDEELEAALGAGWYERGGERRGYRNGKRLRTLTGPTGPAEVVVARGRLFARGGRREREWESRVLPRYQRRLPEINEAIASTYLSGGNTRRIRAALRPLLKDAPLSKSAVSRVIATLKAAFETWLKRPLGELEVAYLYLDAIALKVRRAGKVVSAPVLAAMAVLADGSKQLLSLEMVAGESNEAWKGFVDQLVERRLGSPVLCVIDGNAALRRAVELAFPGAKVQRCTVHKLRNLERKAPGHVIDELRDDYHAIVYAESREAAERAREAFVRKWQKRCPAVVASLKEGGDELLTFYDFPEEQWKTLRTSNAIERLNGEFRRRVKTQASLPTDDAAVVLLYSLVASGQIRLRRIDGHQQLATVLSRKIRRAA